MSRLELLSLVLWFILRLKTNEKVLHLARTGTGELYTGFWWGFLRETDHLEDLGVDGRIFLKRFFKKWNGEVWIPLFWLWIGTGGGRF
jgi:hypothetical protein